MGQKPDTMAGALQTNTPFRFFDNREKYLLFVTSCNEKQVIAERVAMDIKFLRPVPPALRVFDAGMGDATVLTRVMRYLHYQYPTMPFFMVGKEVSPEDVRISLEKMPDRFYEHPLTVLVITNMFYSEAPWLYPNSRAMQSKLNWQEVALEGNSAFEFDEQIRGLESHVQEWWQTRPSEKTGNATYVTPSALVIYRKDHQSPLASVIPQKGDQGHEYDLVIAAQPFRARLPAEVKVRNVLAPLARSLAPAGCMVVIQSTGKDPGMEIVRRIWPGEKTLPQPPPGAFEGASLSTRRRPSRPSVPELPGFKSPVPLFASTTAHRGGHQHQHLDDTCRMECRHLRGPDRGRASETCHEPRRLP